MRKPDPSRIYRVDAETVALFEHSIPRLIEHNRGFLERRRTIGRLMRGMSIAIERGEPIAQDADDAPPPSPSSLSGDRPN